ncbi:MAG: hypothetical protein QM771_10850 [Nitrospira sp.]
MRYQRWTSGLAALSFVLHLSGCLRDSPTPAPGTPPAATSTEMDSPNDVSSTGEIQERAVPPRMKPGATAPLQALPIKPAVIPPPPPLPGQFAIQTFKPNYVTAVDGGGRIADAIRTDAAGIGAQEKFQLLLLDANTNQLAIRTPRGNYLTAVNGGGLTVNSLHTDATQISSWETFRFVLDPRGWRNTIQTVNGRYLTAVGAGGKTTDAIHTDAVKADNWESFYIWKCGDLGSGFQYTISAVSTPYGFLFAYGGGGRVATQAGVVVAGALGVLSDYNLRPAPFDNNWQKFRLMRQNDGSYALQTANGMNYVTAIQGGGLASGTKTYDNLVTDRTQVQAWEKFRFVELGDCSYAIQTVSGNYLGKSTAAPGTALGSFATNVSDIKSATTFRLSMAF